MCWDVNEYDKIGSAVSCLINTEPLELLMLRLQPNEPIASESVLVWNMTECEHSFIGF